MLTGLIGAIGAMMALRDRAKNVGSYHVFASLMAAAALPLKPEVRLYPPEVVKGVDERFKWDETEPELFVLGLLDVVLKGWKGVFPEYFEKASLKLQGHWGEFEVLKPVLELGTEGASLYWASTPEPNCHNAAGGIRWL